MLGLISCVICDIWYVIFDMWCVIWYIHPIECWRSVVSLPFSCQNREFIVVILDNTRTLIVMSALHRPIILPISLSVALDAIQQFISFPLFNVVWRSMEYRGIESPAHSGQKVPSAWHRCRCNALRLDAREDQGRWEDTYPSDKRLWHHGAIPGRNGKRSRTILW